MLTPSRFFRPLAVASRETRRPRDLLLTLLLLTGCMTTRPPTDPAALRLEVLTTERAFARTMAERNHNAFASFLAEDAIFFNGDAPIRGKEAVAAGWRGFFDGPAAPFSWDPDAVHVLDSGELALSTGPVRGPDGQIVARFNSIWRRDPTGEWRIVFDKGSPICNCAAAPP
jgi:ketosteroid isomerase-like protein